MDQKQPPQQQPVQLHPLVVLIQRALIQIDAGNLQTGVEMLKEVVMDGPLVKVAPAVTNFEHAFRTACRKNDVQNCCYVIFNPDPKTGLSVNVGGDQRVATVLLAMIRDAHELSNMRQAAKPAEEKRIIVPSR